MNTEILKKYNLTFSKIKFNDGHTTKTASGGGISGFLSSIYDPDMIKDQITNLDFYINGGEDDYEKSIVSTPVYTAWLDADNADIYFNGDENLLQSIPLKDFKSILLEWKSFLLNE